VTARKTRRLHPELAWPLTSTEIEAALGIEASNHGPGGTGWYAWLKKPSTTPLTIKCYAAWVVETERQYEVTVEPVSRVDRQRVHEAMTIQALPETARWLHELTSRPSTHLAPAPKLMWDWDGDRLSPRFE
jgi:hypothetical protein